MNTEQLIQGLEAKFTQTRILFWYDTELSFEESIPQLTQELDVAGINIITMQGQSTLGVKKQIELDKPEEKFLLYFNANEPAKEDNWLLDIQLYSEQFFPDASSMLLNDLGINQMHLREHIRNRQKFFAAKSRLNALKRLITENETEQSIDQKIISVLVKADSSSINDIVLAVSKQGLVDSDNNSPSVLAELDKYGVLQSFWDLIVQYFAYQLTTKTDEPDSEVVYPETINDFVLKLFCTDLYASLQGGGIDSDKLIWLQSNTLSTRSGRANAVSFMANWRYHGKYKTDYNHNADFFDEQLEIKKYCKEYPYDTLINVETFESIEQLIILGLVDELLDDKPLNDRAAFEEILATREASHWCQCKAKSGGDYQGIYQALRAAELLHHLRNEYHQGFYYDSVQEMYHAYTKTLYQFDQAYRQFNAHAFPVLNKGKEILRQLDNKIEEVYVNWYLFQLSNCWDTLLEKEKFIDNWRLTPSSSQEVQSQQNFYDRKVKHTLNYTKAKRVFVIISDALRYEVAQELTQRISDEKRFATTLETQLGVLPSYTQLGMAALLPHEQLSYGDSNQKSDAAVLVDGTSSSGLENRNKQLAKYQGMAVSAKEFFSWSNTIGREKIKDAQVVYIYHDSIDAIGDKRPTEDKTFEACEDAIGELKDIVTRVINTLKANQVLITADHGFIFQQQILQNTDKTELKIKPTNTIEAKKRYILGKHLSEIAGCWHGQVSTTAGASCETKFLLPKGNNRFHFIGGAKFVHGGAMLQEVCVPIITIKELQKKQAEKQAKQKVDILPGTPIFKLVNNIDKLKFIQAEAIDDNVKPRTVELHIVDTQGNTVSSKERLVFDATSKSMDERTREARIKLTGSNYDRNVQYTLIISDAEFGTEYARYGVTIDLAFDDFF